MTLTILALVGVMLVGVPLTRVLDARLRGAALAGTSFLLGAGAIVLHLFALSLMRVPWTRTSVLLALVPMVALAVGGWRLAGDNPPPSFSRQPPTANRQPSKEGSRLPGLFLDLGVVLILLAYAIFATWAIPFEWDFFGIWGLKGRAFYDARAIDWTFVQTNISHPDYPLLVPLLFDFVAVVTGGWNERAFGLIYVALAAALVGIARGLLREELRTHTLAALATLAVVFPALNVWIGLGEGAVMAFGCAGLLFLRRGDAASVRIGAVLLGFSAWSKNEGLALIGVSVMAMLIATRSIRKVMAMWPAVAVIAPWLVARSMLKLSTDFMEGSVIDRVLDRLRNPGDVVRAFSVSPPDQPWLWLVIVLVILAFAREAVRREAFLLVALTLQIGLMLGQALATRWDLAAHVSLTMNRLPHQIVPAAAFLAAVLTIRAWGNARE